MVPIEDLTLLEQLEDALYLEEARQDPRPAGVRSLTREAGFLRLRVGDYRIMYQVDDLNRSVLVVKIGHRGEVYRKP